MSDGVVGEFGTIVVKGQTDPNLQGWFCMDGKQLVPNQALGFKKTGTSSYFTTFFDHSSNKVKKPSFNIGTNGKYVRLTMRYSSEMHDLTIREMEDGSREVTYQNGDETHTTTIPAKPIEVET